MSSVDDANLILQSILDVIDNKKLWEKHHEQLNDIHKEDSEKSQDDHSIDKIAISEYLELELDVYGLYNSEEFVDFLNKIRQLEQAIPKVFNFKERLKLALCAVCHVDLASLAGGEPVNNSELSRIFDDIQSLKPSPSEPTPGEPNDNNPSGSSATDGYTEEINNLKTLQTANNKQYTKQNEFIEQLGEKINNMVRKRLSSDRTLRSARRRSQNGGGGLGKEDLPKLNILTDFLKGKFTERINSFNVAYGRLLNTDDKEDKKSIRSEMYNILNNLLFSQLVHSNSERSTMLDLLKQAFHEYLELALQSISSDNIKNKLKKEIDDAPITIYNNFLKNYFFNFDSVKKDGGESYHRFIPNNIEEIQELYFDDDSIDNPIKLFLSHYDAEREIDDSHGIAIFQEYMDYLFSFYLTQFLNEKPYIDEEIVSLEKRQGAENRKKTNIDIDFKSMNAPILRQFFIFVYNCISQLSGMVNTEDSWSILEKKIRKKIINTKEGDEFIYFLNDENPTNKVKAKLAYFLINMKYF